MYSTLALRGIFAVVVLACMASHAEPSSDPTVRAQSILSKAAGYLAAQDAFEFKADVTYAGVINGEPENVLTKYTITFKRPDKISVRALNPEIDFQFVSDGDRYIRYIPEYGQFISEPNRMSVEEIISTSGFEVITPALELLSQLVEDTPYAQIAGAPELEYVGDETLRGIETHHIRMAKDNARFELWIEQGDKPLIRKIKPDMTAMQEKLGNNAGITFEISVIAEIFDWESGAQIEDGLAFIPPEGVVEVVSFRPPMPAEKLRGKEAPDFTVPLLDGGTLTLSEKKGKIVILDFWATWCGPCRIAMPVLSAVAKEFADDGVLLYGINLREDKGLVGAYLENSDLDLSVGLDLDGSVGDIYKADSIPQTVIVGRDGKIEIVHVGLWEMPSRADAVGMTREEENKMIFDTLADSLRKELRELVDR